MHKAIFGSLLLLLNIASAQSDDRPKSDLLITLERTECLGSCPVYKITIRGDGSVVYQGHKFVRVEGTRRTTVDPEKVLAIAQAFVDAGYFDLADHYRSIKNPDGTVTVVTDLPTTYTSLMIDSRSKEVEDYVGAPKPLKELERKVDELAGSKRWVAIDSESLHEEVKHGFNVMSAQGQKLFLDAVERGDGDVVRAFIQEGIDVNARIRDIVPLQRARGVDVVKALIAAGADVNATSKNYLGPPLNFAAESGDLDAVQALVNAGARLNGRSRDGITALMLAAERGDPPTVKFLLQAGADAKLKSGSGKSALDCARNGLDSQKILARQPDPFNEPLADYQEKYKEISDMLTAAGAEASK